MSVPLLDLHAQIQAMRDDLLGALHATVDSAAFIMGQPVRDLEAAVARHVGAAEAVACASGTDALMLSLKTLDLAPGDEVITTPFTFFATAGAIHNAGGTPVFVDIRPDTFNLDVDAVAAAIGPRTRAILPVHLYGQMAPMEAIQALATRHGLAVIEDAAQAIGATRRMGDTVRQAGAVGTTGCYSFFPSKNLGGFGDGGMIVTQDAALAERLRRLRTHGGAKQYHHDEIGFNSRLDTLQAAVLLAKLPRLEQWNAARRANAEAYDAALTGVPGVVTPAVDPANVHTYHQYTIRVPDRDGLVAHLKGQGIGCAVYYPRALHQQPCFAPLGYTAGQFPEAERATAEVVSLPIYPELTAAHRARVVDAVRAFVA